MKNKTLVYSAVIIGILFIIIAIVYFVTPANSLPAYMPGYDLASNKIHFKHGIASTILGLGLFILAWFKSGKKS